VTLQRPHRPDPARATAPARGTRGLARRPARHGDLVLRRDAVLAAGIALAALAAAPVAGAQGAGWMRAAVPIDWQTSPLDLDLRGMNGERYAFACPAGKPQPARVTGSGPYTDDSSICTAAVHAGALHARDGGFVTIEIRPGEARYAGSERHYIHTSGTTGAWSGSFVVLDATAPVTAHPARKP
jgi:hypothetical protein